MCNYIYTCLILTIKVKHLLAQRWTIVKELKVSSLAQLANIKKVSGINLNQEGVEKYVHF